MGVTRQMILRYNPIPTSCLRSTVYVLYTNGRMNTFPVAGRRVTLADCVPREKGTLLSSRHPRWRMNVQEHKDNGLGVGQGNFFRTSRCWRKEKERKKGFQLLAAVISQLFFLLWPQMKAPQTESPLSLCRPTTDIPRLFHTGRICSPTTDVSCLFHTGRISCFKVFVRRPEPGSRDFIWVSQTRENKLFSIALPRVPCPALGPLSAPSQDGKYYVGGKGFRKPRKGRQVMNYRT